MDMPIWSVTKDILAVIGTIFTVIGAAAGVISVLPDSALRGTFIERSQINIAQSIAPSGYVVKAEQASVIGEGAGFALKGGQGTQLYYNGSQETFSIGVINEPFVDAILINVNGQSQKVQTGADIPLSPFNNCRVFYSGAEGGVPGGPNRLYHFSFKC